MRARTIHLVLPLVEEAVLALERLHAPRREAAGLVEQRAVLLEEVHAVVGHASHDEDPPLEVVCEVYT